MCEKCPDYAGTTLIFRTKNCVFAERLNNKTASRTWILWQSAGVRLGHCGENSRRAFAATSRPDYPKNDRYFSGLLLTRVSSATAPVAKPPVKYGLSACKNVAVAQWAAYFGLNRWVAGGFQ
jgi:hypothetical protein